MLWGEVGSVGGRACSWVRQVVLEGGHALG